jgi:fibronectin-binding autotransporter adhesin
MKARPIVVSAGKAAIAVTFPCSFPLGFIMSRFGNMNMIRASLLALGVAVLTILAALPQASGQIMLQDNPGAPAAVGNGSVGNAWASTSTNTDPTASFTVAGAGSTTNEVLVFEVGWKFNAAVTVPSTIQWGTQSLTLAESRSSVASTYRTDAIYYLYDPIAGTNNFTGFVKNAGGNVADTDANAFTLIGVSTTSAPLVASGETTGYNATPLSFTGVAANSAAVIAQINNQTDIANFAATVGGGQVQNYNGNPYLWWVYDSTSNGNTCGLITGLGQGSDTLTATPAAAGNNAAAPSKCPAIAAVFAPAPVTPPGPTLYWSGATNGNWSLSGTDANWTGGATSFSNSGNYPVTFSDTGANTSPITIVSGGVQPNSVLFTSNTAVYSFTGGPIAAAAGGVTLNGSGLVVLSNSNTYTGPTTISGGTLQLGTGQSGQDGSIGGTNGVTNNSAMVYSLVGSQTASYAMNGSGSLTTTGTNVLVLTGNSTAFTGPTTVSAGTLQLGNGGASGAVGGPIVNNGALVINRNDAQSAYAVSNVISGSGSLTVNGGGYVTLNSGANTYTGITTITNSSMVSVTNVDAELGPTPNSFVPNQLSFTGAGGSLVNMPVGQPSGASLTIDANRGIFVGSGATATFRTGYGGVTITINSVISGPGGIAKTDTNTDSLILNAANTFSGTTGWNAIGGQAQGGFIQLGNALALQNSTVNENATGGGNLTFTGSVGTFTIGGLMGTVNQPLADLNNAAVTLQVGNNNANTTYSGVLSGSGILAKIGTGVLNLSGTDTYTGGTTINSGTLGLAGGLTGGGAIAVVPGAAITEASTGLISGAASLASSGATTLAGSNTYSGGTTIGGGVLRINADAALGTAAGALTFANNGSLQAAAGLSLNASRNVVINSGVTATLDTNGNAMGILGVISGSGAISKISAGTLTLAGSNSFGGGTTINAGVLNINADASLGAVPSSAATNLAFAGSGTLQFGANNVSLSANRGIAISGVTATFDTQGNSATIAGTIADGTGGPGALFKANSGTLYLTGANTYSGGTTINSGILNINADAALGTPPASPATNITFTNNSTLQFGANNVTLSAKRNIAINSGVTATFDNNGYAAGLAGAITGSGSLATAGAGILTLSGSNTYSGSTAVNVGTLNVASPGFLGTTAISVGGSGSLAATGTTSVGGNVSVAAGGQINLASGGINSLSIGGGLSLATGAALDFNLGTTAGVSSLLALAGSASMSPFADTLNITAGAVIPNGTYTLLTAGSGGLAPFTVGSQPAILGTFNFNQSTSTALILTVSANPFQPTVYWTGNGSQANGDGANNWNSHVGSGNTLTSNWSTDPAGISDAEQVPGSITDVYFTAANAVPNFGNTLSTQLNAAYSIKGLFIAVPTLPGMQITSTAINLNGNALTIGGDGLTLAAASLSSATLTGLGSVLLGSSAESWANNNATLPLTFNSGIAPVSGLTTLTFSGSGAGGIVLGGALSNGSGLLGQLALVFNQAGTTQLNAANTFTGGVTISSGTVQLGSGGSISSTSGISDDGTLVYSTAGATVQGCVISGSGSLAVQGPGIVTLTNSGNTFSGVTTISGGTLQLGLGTVGNDGSVAGNITANATLAFNYFGSPTFAGTISGSGGVAINGPGTATLAAANTFSGGVALNQGALQLANAAAVQNSTVTIASGGSLTFASGIGSFGIGGLAGSGNLALQDATANPVALTVGGNGQNTTYSGVLSAAGSLTLAGPGMLTLANANAYTGNTLVSGGTLALGNSLALQQSTLDTSGSGSLSFGSLTSATLGGLTGGGSLVLNNAGGGPVALSVGNNGFNAVSSGAISGGGGLTKIGGGTQVLAGVNSYSASTTLTAGELSISSSGNIGGANAAIIFNGGTLQVTGTNLTSIDNLPVNWASFNGGFDIASAANSFTVASSLGGTGGLSMSGAGLLSLTASNASFSGPATVNGGTLNIANPVALQNSTVTVNAGGVLTFSSSITASALGALSGSGNVALYNSLLTVGGNNASTTYSGAMSGAGGFVKTGNGTMSLGGNSAYAGPTTVAGGVLQLGSLTNTTIAVASSAAFLTTTTQNNTEAFTVGAGANLLVVEISWRNNTPTPTLPVVQYNGTLNLTPAVSLFAGNVNTNQTDSAIFFLSSPPTGTGSLTVNYPAQPTDSAMEAISLSGVNLNTLTSGTNAVGGNGLAAATLSMPLTVATPGSWEAFATAYRQGTGALLAATITAGNGALVGTSNGNVYNNVDANTVEAGGLISNTTSSSVTLQETAGGAPGGGGIWSLVGAVLSPQQEGSLLNALPATTPLIVGPGGTLDLAGGTQTVASLSDAAPGLGGTIQNSGGAATLTLSPSGGSTTFSGQIVGGAFGPINLVLTGSGVQVLAGNNTYTGTTTICGGTLQIGNGGASGSLGNGGNVVNNSNLSFDIGGGGALAVANVISGSGNVVSAGSGLVMLSGPNGYTGGTTVSGGTLQLGSAAALGTGGLTANAGVVDLAGNSPTVATLNGLAGTITSSVSGGSLTVTSGGAFSGTIEDDPNLLPGTAPVGLILTGGALVLSGTNTYSGGTLVSGGTLLLDNNEALADGSSLMVGANLGAFGPVVPAASSAYPAEAVSAVPEPGCVALLAVAGIVAAAAGRRKRTIRRPRVIPRANMLGISGGARHDL